MHYTRDIKTCLLEDLKTRMIFLGGPRQVGKTTFCRKQLLPNARYLNWDNLKDRKQIKEASFANRGDEIVLDEIHKYRHWRALLKGVFDEFGAGVSMICTGSARLDSFRRGGDSLFGRYRYYRLHPVSLMEMAKKPSRSDLEQLLEFGGFPWPLKSASKRELARWQRERQELVIKQDLIDIMRVRDLSNLDMMADLLPQKVGSLLSIKSIQEDLEVSPHTVESWLKLFESVYYCHRISPYGTPKIRAIKKQQKLYLYDWSTIESRGARFENMVAAQLLKYCHYLEDVHGERMELRYLRDVDGREIDFVVLKNKKPIFAVECKAGESQLSPAISYYAERTPIPAFYQVHMGKRDYGTTAKGRVLPFEKFCTERIVTDTSSR